MLPIAQGHGRRPLLAQATSHDQHNRIAHSTFTSHLTTLYTYWVILRDQIALNFARNSRARTHVKLIHNYNYECQPESFCRNITREISVFEWQSMRGSKLTRTALRTLPAEWYYYFEFMRKKYRKFYYDVYTLAAACRKTAPQIVKAKANICGMELFVNLTTNEVGQETRVCMHAASSGNSACSLFSATLSTMLSYKTENFSLEFLIQNFYRGQVTHNKDSNMPYK